MSKFKKGQIPWNKGKKGSVKPNSGSFKKGINYSPNTQFKKGDKGKLGTKHSIETRKIISDNRKGKAVGDKNPSWKGGITKIKQEIRKSFEYKLWRESVFKRDNYTCIWCKNRGCTLNADHIKPFSLYPELRFAIDNGRTLCVPCHRTTETYGSKLRKYERK
jgi:hypothetical protein